VKASKKQKVVLTRLLLCVVFVSAAALALKVNGQRLRNEARILLQSFLSRNTELDFKFSRVSVRWNQVRFEGVQVIDPATEPASSVFSAQSVLIRYRLLDLLSKKGDSSIEIQFQSPKVRWQPPAGVSRQQFPFLRWMREWAVDRRKHFSLRIRDLELEIGAGGPKIGGIDAWIKGDAFEVIVPFRHADVSHTDISSTWTAQGRFELGAGTTEDMLMGRLSTEGTVINWQPLARESHFDFIFSRQGFYMTSSDFLAGLQIQVEVDFDHGYDFRVAVKADNYTLSQLDPFIRTSYKFALPGRADVDAVFYGRPWAPNYEADLRVHDGWIKKTAFKMLDLHLAGVYPTVSFTDSRMLLPDGSVMRFADKTLEFRDLFETGTFEVLLSDAEEDSVVWGDWEFRRPRGVNEPAEFLMQRSLSDKAFISLKKSSDLDRPEADPVNPVGVGFEYRLRSKDTLKFELREEERFVGVERKLKF